MNGPILTAPFAAPELYPSATGTFYARETGPTLYPTPIGPGGYANGDGWGGGGFLPGPGGGPGGVPVGPGGLPLPWPPPVGPPLPQPRPPRRRIDGDVARMSYNSTCLVPSGLVCGSWRGRKRLLGFDGSGNPFYGPPVSDPTGSPPPGRPGRFGAGLPGAYGGAGLPSGGGGVAPGDVILEGFPVAPPTKKKAAGGGWILLALAAMGLTA